MVEVFVDTSAWYALRVANDANHAEAVRALKGLAGGSAVLHTSDWVLVETVSLLSSRVGRPDALAAGAWILYNPAVRVHGLGGELTDAWRLLRDAGTGVSLVDCGSFALMDRLGLRRAFAFDEDFARRGFEPV